MFIFSFNYFLNEIVFFLNIIGFFYRPHLGDDEQSDWVWDGARAGWEEESGELHLSLAPPSLPSASRSLARYIRGGRRRLRSDKAGFTVLTSANEKLSRFLQDPDKSQLRYISYPK